MNTKKTPNVLSITKEMIDFIKRKEGFRSRSYLCPAGVWTIGYGTTKYTDGFPVIEGEDITKERAEELLMNELEILQYTINNFLIKNKIHLNRFQFSALVSFAFNVGYERVTKHGSVYRGLLRLDMPYVTKGMKKYCKVTKRKLGIPYKVKVDGLVQRRKEEVEYFWSGSWI